MRTIVIAFAVLLASPLSAQRIPDPVDNRREIQLHDVRAVLDAIGLRHDLPAAFEAEPEGAEALHRRDRLQDVAELARSFVQPRLHDPTLLQPLGDGLLVLRGDPQQQVSLEGILRALSQWEDQAIELECKLVKVPQKAFAADVVPIIGLQKPIDSGGGNAAGAALGPEGAARLQAALKLIEGCEIVQNPRLLILPAQLASLSILQEIRYRKDYEVEVKGAEFVVWPITGELKDGLVLELRAAPIAGKTLGVAVHGTLSEVQRPIPTFETTLAGSTKKVTVDLPEVAIRRFDANLRLGDRHLGVVVSGTADDAERLLLLVRAGVR